MSTDDDERRKRSAAGFKAAETKGWEERSRGAKAAWWTRKHPDRPRSENPYNKGSAHPYDTDD